MLIELVTLFFVPVTYCWIEEIRVRVRTVRQRVLHNP
jgi:hypothetical protein